MTDILKIFPQKQREKVFYFLIGFVLSGLMCIDIEYPVYYENMETFREMCIDSSPKIFYVNIIGRVSKLRCEDGREILLKN